ncbi:MAG: CRISPR-associated protein Cas4 [Candidatus Odinarchaeia archaeon]
MTLNEDYKLKPFFDEISYTGTQINYYFICKRKLWYFSHHIELEANSNLVLLGKLLHEYSYQRKFKEVEIDRIKVDFMRENEIHEIKRSRKMEKAHLYQLLYYMFYLKKYNINAKGKLHYPLLKKVLDIKLTNEYENELIKVLQEIKKIISETIPPPPIKKKYCKKCSYFELCWS